MHALGVELLQLRAQAGACVELLLISCFGDLDRVPLAFFPSTCFRVSAARGVTRGAGRGALNAGRAWLHGGGVVDDLAEFILQVLWDCASSFPFIGLTVICEWMLA